MNKKKILSWGLLKKKLAQERSKGNKIVFTNGVFDILHVGHLKVFLKCRNYGDVLVLGLNSDASVRRLKGPNRPIVPQNERAQMLSGLATIDYVTIFTDDTPAKLIQLVQPDVLVKGGDWKKSAIVGADIAKKVVRSPVVKGRSSTNIIEKVLKVYGSNSKQKKSSHRHR